MVFEPLIERRIVKPAQKKSSGFIVNFILAALTCIWIFATLYEIFTLQDKQSLAQDQYFIALHLVVGVGILISTLVIEPIMQRTSVKGIAVIFMILTLLTMSTLSLTLPAMQRIFGPGFTTSVEQRAESIWLTYQLKPSLMLTKGFGLPADSIPPREVIILRSLQATGGMPLVRDNVPALAPIIHRSYFNRASQEIYGSALMVIVGGMLITLNIFCLLLQCCRIVCAFLPAAKRKKGRRIGTFITVVAGLALVVYISAGSSALINTRYYQDAIASVKTQHGALVAIGYNFAIHNQNFLWPWQVKAANNMNINYLYLGLGEIVRFTPHEIRM